MHTTSIENKFPVDKNFVLNLARKWIASIDSSAIKVSIIEDSIAHDESSGSFEICLHNITKCIRWPVSWEYDPESLGVDASLLIFVGDECLDGGFAWFDVHALYEHGKGFYSDFGIEEHRNYFKSLDELITQECFEACIDFLIENTKKYKFIAIYKVNSSTYAEFTNTISNQENLIHSEAIVSNINCDFSHL